MIDDDASLVTGFTSALYIAARDPRVPWQVKLAAAAIAADALSPSDPMPGSLLFQPLVVVA